MAVLLTLSRALPAGLCGPRVVRSLASPGIRAPVLLLVVVLLVPALAAAAASAQKLKQPGAAKSLRTHVRQTNALPDVAASKAKQRKLVRAGLVRRDCGRHRRPRLT